MRAAGLDPERLAEARIDPREIHALVELHIEQGAVLEAEGVPIGVVERIAAPHDHRITLVGMARHAGSTPMSMRRDALTGAAEIVLEVERLARDSRSGTTVGTVGVLHALPGAVNVIPGEVILDVDIRDSDLEVRTEVVDAMLARVQSVAAARGLQVEVETITRDVPAQCAARVVSAVRDACVELEIPHIAMISGAYHDSMVLGGGGVPMGMIFVPSVDGISHHPAEATDPADLETGVRVLAGALARLSA
jgi:hydantoinase/carbamoylase family amidase